MASFAKTPWDILGATCGGSKMAIVGRDPKMATNARGPQSDSTGVEEQEGLWLCVIVQLLFVCSGTEQAWSRIRTGGG